MKQPQSPEQSYYTLLCYVQNYPEHLGTEK